LGLSGKQVDNLTLASLRAGSRHYRLSFLTNSISPLTDLPPIHRDQQLQRLWAVGMLMSLIRWLEILAFAVFTYDQTKSALWVASLMMLRLLPLSLFGLALGALASHMSRRWLLIVTHAGLFATCFLLLSVSAFGAIEVWHLAVASFVNGIVWAGDMPLRRALMGDLAGQGRMRCPIGCLGVIRPDLHTTDFCGLGRVCGACNPWKHLANPQKKSFSFCAAYHALGTGNKSGCQ
jgi:hypothetical protein